MLAKSIKILEVVLESMEPGAKRDANIVKLDGLKAQLKNFKSVPPKGRYVTWDLEEVTGKHRPCPGPRRFSRSTVRRAFAPRPSGVKSPFYPRIDQIMGSRGFKLFG